MSADGVVEALLLRLLEAELASSLCLLDEPGGALLVALRLLLPRGGILQFSHTFFRRPWNSNLPALESELVRRDYRRPSCVMVRNAGRRRLYVLSKQSLVGVSCGTSRLAVSQCRSRASSHADSRLAPTSFSEPAHFLRVCRAHILWAALTKMEDAGAQFVAMMVERLDALEQTVQAQQAELELATQKPPLCLVSGSICSEQMAFSDGTALHWSLGKPPGMYPSGEAMVPLAPPYGDWVIAKGPQLVFVCDTTGVGFNVCISGDAQFVTLRQLMDKVNCMLNGTVHVWSALEAFMNRSAWELRQTAFGWQLQVYLDVPPGG